MLTTTTPTRQQMDATLVTATMYTAGGVANLVVVLNIMRRWPGRGASLSAALSISAVSLSLSCGKSYVFYCICFYNKKLCTLRKISYYTFLIYKIDTV